MKDALALGRALPDHAFAEADLAIDPDDLIPESDA